MTVTQAIVAAVSDIKRWTWRGYLALFLIVTAYYLPRFVSVPVTATDVLEHANLVGMALLMIELAAARKEMPPSILPKDPPNGGSSRDVMTYETPREGPAKPLERRGWGLVPRAALLALWCAFIVPACASREMRTEHDVYPELWQGPPCRLIVTVDGEVVFDARSPKRCELKIDPPKPPPALDAPAVS